VLKNFQLYFTNLYRRKILRTNVVAPYAAIFYATHKCNLDCAYYTQKEPEVFSDELEPEAQILIQHPYPIRPEEEARLESLFARSATTTAVQNDQRSQFPSSLIDGSSGPLGRNQQCEKHNYGAGQDGAHTVFRRHA
jgi:hypothetical protein